jgi:hypothetical protein
MGEREGRLASSRWSSEPGEKEVIRRELLALFEVFLDHCCKHVFGVITARLGNGGQVTPEEQRTEPGVSHERNK